MLPSPGLEIIAALFGLFIGSFISLASYRLPLGTDIILKRSACPKCQHPLTILDLIPILSWCAFRAQCRHCSQPISARYPFIELITAILFALVAYLFGATLLTFLICLLATTLLILIITDLDHYLIPDSIQLTLAIIGCAYGWLMNVPWQTILIAVIFGGGLGLALHFGYKWIRHKDGLGWGDVKFLAISGLFIPLEFFALFLLMSGILGIMTGIAWKIAKKSSVFPFGPALAIALFITVIIQWL